MESPFQFTILFLGFFYTTRTMRNFVPIITLLCLAFSSVACQNVVFTEPQPVKVSSETSFPQDWQGLFKNIPLPGEEEGGNAWVKVTEDKIFLYTSRIDSVPYLEEDYKSGEIPEIGDSVTVILRGQMVDALFVKDEWARFFVQKMDTLNLSDSLILKLTEGWAFLNMPDEEHGKQYWNGILIEPIRNGDLLLWSIEDGEDEAEYMNQFFDIEEIEDPDYIGKLRVATPKQKEFKAYVDAGGFPDLFMWLSRKFNDDQIPQALK